MAADNTEKRRRRRRGAAQPVADEAELDELDSDEEDDEAAERALTAGKGRATPGRRVAPEEEKKGNFITRPLYGIAEYFEGVRSELGKVSWPTREETRRLTVIVLVATIIASIVLGLIGLAFTELFRLGLQTPAIFVVFLIVAIVVGFVLYRRNKSSEVSPY